MTSPGESTPAVMDQADKVVCRGYTAIADAVFAKPADRDCVEHVAGLRQCRLSGCGSKRRKVS